jgi:hypothetical protein
MRNEEIDHTGTACLGLYTNTGTAFTAATTDGSHSLHENGAHHEECAGAAGEVAARKRQTQ